MPVVRTDGLSGGREVYGHVITKFSRMSRLLHFLTHGAPLARFARESSAKRLQKSECNDGHKGLCNNYLEGAGGGGVEKLEGGA